MIGTQIGPFLTLRLLGAGGMGSVYLAEHCLMKDLHAIKVLDPQLTQNPQIVTRFVNEARAAARLRHRNLVRVHNIERLPGDGAWFMVLDYLEGSTLARFMAGHGGPIAPRLILHILAQVANCIQHVHDNRIVHRDLKPDNIFLIQRDDDLHFPVVLDLGVAQLGEDLASGPATKTGTVIGTPIYMAPEQLRGERVSPAADVFALGVIAYEMSTGGYFPYQYDEAREGYFELPATEIYYRQRSAPPCDPRRRCAGLDDAWIHALGAALQLDPRARPASMQDFALLLADAIPAGDDHPDGRAIVRQVARELVQGRSDHDARSSHPMGTAHAAAIRRFGDGSGPEAARELPPERTTLTEPISTLDGAASQSVAGARAAPRWAKIAGGGIAALVAGALASFAVVRWTAGDERPARTQVAGADRTAHVSAPAAAAPLVVAGAVSRTAKTGAGDATGTLPAETTSYHTAGSNPVELARSGAVRPETPSAATAGSVAGAPDAAPPGAVRVGTGPTATTRAPSTPTSAPAPATGPSHSGPPPATPRSSPPSDPGARAPSPPSTTAARKSGELAIIVRPWALIWLNGRSLGQTPFREKVAAGRYLVRIANDDVGKDETFTIVVSPENTTTVQRTW